MKAAVLREPKTPLVIEDVPRPAIDAGDVLIQVEACGVCHSDLHVAEGDWKQFAGITKKPLILGHEIAGRVVEAGPAVRDLKVGDRVGVPWIYWTCGECDFCREGFENLCTRQKITGVTVDGGYAEFVKAPATHATEFRTISVPWKQRRCSAPALQSIAHSSRRIFRADNGWPSSAWAALGILAFRSVKRWARK